VPAPARSTPAVSGEAAPSLNAGAPGIRPLTWNQLRIVRATRLRPRSVCASAGTQLDAHLGPRPCLHHPGFCLYLLLAIDEAHAGAPWSVNMRGSSSSRRACTVVCRSVPREAPAKAR
jgi:hypothetical protein